MKLLPWQAVLFSTIFSTRFICTEAQTTSSVPVIVPSTNTSAINNNGVDGYSYAGCYNETTSDTNTRALYQGTSTTNTDMTVAQCLEFCNKPGATNVPDSSSGYAYAGLEYSKECYCSVYLSSFSNQVPEDQCDLPCIGNTSERCGGYLRLSLYKKSTTTKKNNGVSLHTLPITAVGALTVLMGILML